MKLFHSEKFLIVFIVQLTSFIVPFMTSALNLSIPAIGKEFPSSATSLSWIVSSYLLISASFLLPFGRLSDIVGQKKIYTIGIFLMAVFSFLCGIAWSLSVLIFFRLGQGLASAMIFSPGVAIISAIFPPEKRGKMLGLTVTAVYIGLAVGPVLGGFINHYFGWRCIFYLAATAMIFVAFIALKKLTGEWIGAQGEKMDFTGSGLYILSVSTILYSFSAIISNSWAKYLLVAGIVLLFFFLTHQSRQEHPLFNVALCRSNLVFTMSNLAAMINYSATFGLIFLLSMYLQTIKHYDSQSAGLLLLIVPVMITICAPFSGALSGHIQPRLLSSCGMGFSMLSLFFFIFLTPNTPLWFFIVCLILMGIGTGTFTSPNTNAIMGSVGKKYAGVAASIMSTMRLTGQASSMAIVTLLLSIQEKNSLASQSEILLTIMPIAFFIFTILCGFGILASIFRGKVTQNDIT